MLRRQKKIGPTRKILVCVKVSGHRGEKKKRRRDYGFSPTDGGE
jgi:hypothetical protein